LFTLLGLLAIALCQGIVNQLAERTDQTAQSDRSDQTRLLHLPTRYCTPIITVLTICRITTDYSNEANNFPDKKRPGKSPVFSFWDGFTALAN
jgi:hypothetical protein